MTRPNGETGDSIESGVDTAFALAPVPMAIVDRAGEIQRANQAFQEFFACRHDDKAGVREPSGSLGRLSETLAAQIPITAFPTFGEQSEIAVHLRAPDGHVRHLSLGLQSLGNTAASPVLVTVLQQSAGATGQTEPERELERFYYLASHDLQEPLRKIVAFSQVLKRRLSGALTDKDAVFELERLDDAARRMSAMLKGLLELSRYSHCPLQIRECTLAELVDKALAAMAIERTDKNHTITISQNGPVFVDLAAMTVVFEHIIHNSITFASPTQHTQIDIGCEQHRADTEITITDKGPAVAPQRLEEIFEPFARFCDKTIAGNGIGLALSRKIVQRHGGQIHAELNDTHAPQVQPGLKVVMRIPSLSY